MQCVKYLMVPLDAVVKFVAVFVAAVAAVAEVVEFAAATANSVCQAIDLFETTACYFVWVHCSVVADRLTPLNCGHFFVFLPNF